MIEGERQRRKCLKWMNITDQKQQLLPISGSSSFFFFKFEFLVMSLLLILGLMLLVRNMGYETAVKTS